MWLVYAKEPVICWSVQVKLTLVVRIDETCLYKFMLKRVISSDISHTTGTLTYHI